MQIPKEVQHILEQLELAGYEAYLVGGCVRDSLLGMAPHDWDVATSAHPEQVLECFSNATALPTGLRYGTVTVHDGGISCEVTSYRSEWGIKDGRHPDGVRFGCSLEEDLKRRDFTINAMAYHPHKGLVDPFAGAADLRAGVIRCVGNPDLRFQEDGLRILRALRFAATYIFSVEAKTAQAIRRNRQQVSKVSGERVFGEFCRLLVGQGAPKVLREFPEVMAEFLPELAPSFGFDQRNPHHCLDVWEHTLRALEDTPTDVVVRLAVLLHDIGKPYCFTLDDAGVGHFYGHHRHSVELAERLLHRLRCSKEITLQIIALVQWHDAPLDTERQILRMLRRMGEPLFRKLLLVKRADIRAHAPADIPPGEAHLQNSQQLLEGLLRRHACFSLKDLAVDGMDLLRLGFPRGPLLGRCLKMLLEEVLDGRLENRRGPLLDRATEILNLYGLETVEKKGG